jgi:2-aminoadipate transaminase
VFAEVGTDQRGLRTDVLEDLLVAGLRPKLLYTVPNFQNPSGATLPLERRRHLAQLADRFGFLIVEDDPYGVLRFRGEHVPSIRTFSDRVVTLGTASKLLAPGLRVAWLAAPAWLFGSLVRLKQAADLHTSTLSQRIAADILADHDFVAAHVRRVAAIYRERCDALAGSIADSVEVVVPDGGMFLWGRVRGDIIDTTELLPRAVELGVAFVPGAAFHASGGGRESLRLSFSTLTPITSTFSRGLNSSTRTLSPGFKSSSPGRRESSRRNLAPSTPAFFKCPVRGLLMRDGFTNSMKPS